MKAKNGFSRLDEKFMAFALFLASQKSRFKISPNPRVGCVIVKNNKIVGRGWHQKFGGPHAEVFALMQAGKKARGATAYVSLEPCNHFGKTPPCTEALLRAGVHRVVCAVRDPHAKAGGGIERLYAGSVKVEVGLLGKQARLLNEKFFKWAATGVPFVSLKAALTLDAFIAPFEGSKRFWISSKQSRAKAHLLRAGHDAILVGAGTILADDPRLTARLSGMRQNAKLQPLKVVLDEKLRCPLNAKVFANANALVAVGKNCNKAKKRALEALGVNVLVCPAGASGVDLKFLLLKLGKMGVSSLLVEGGGKVFESFLKLKLVDRVHLFVAPNFLDKGVPFASKKTLRKLALADVNVEMTGQDFYLNALVKK